MVLTDVAPSQYDQHPAIFDLGCRYLAYATTTSPDTHDKNNKIQMSVVAEKVAKEVISGVKVLGNIGLQAVKAAKNSYYQNSSSNNSNDTNNILINDESLNSKNNEISYQFPVGMIKIFDIRKLLEAKDISNVTPLAHFQAQHHYMEYIQFNESGSLLITSSCEGFTLNIWKIENHFDKKAIPLTCLYKLKRGKTSARIESVSFSTDSRWVCVLSNHGTAHLYYIDPFGMEEMYKRNEVMKMYNDIPISNVNSSNYKNIRSKSINEMVNTNLITPKIPSPQTSPTAESPPNSSNKLSPTSGEGVTSNEYNTSSSLNINTLKQNNYHSIPHSYHSTNSANEEFSYLSSSFKSNSYSSSYRNSYMNYVNPNSNGSNTSGKPIQSFAISRIKFKKCSFYYVDSNQASHALAMNMNHKLGTGDSTTSSTTMAINDSSSYSTSSTSLEGNEYIHPILYSPASCGKFLNKVKISSDKREPNEKQKIIIFRITEDRRQGQLELYKIIGNDNDDSSINLDPSPTSITSNLNNNISPRRKSFSYSPSNSIKELSFDDALHIYSSTSVVTTKNIQNNNSNNNIIYSGGGNQLIIADEGVDSNTENYKFNDVESVTLSSVKTKTISCDEEGNEFEELSDEDENQNNVLGLESNPNDDLQLIEENVIQEEDHEDTDKVIVSKLSQQKNNNNNSYVSTTTTITHLYISPDPPENVIKKT
ncbi:hypothetical protein PIROE2DRAFT_64216 [Piromyces sp. E2]|nr:hypothetical protein PIROE2DRAFT_64216 [Piromyces sp. E2]|eukprot:OUM58732.1 hypothetical protein PIROE2DRAFT_64216 [Piromyces sp. E2]